MDQRIVNGTASYGQEQSWDPDSDSEDEEVADVDEEDFDALDAIERIDGSRTNSSSQGEDFWTDYYNPFED